MEAGSPHSSLHGLRTDPDPVSDSKATLLSCNDSVDTSTPMGQSIVGVLIGAAETEAQNTSLRVTRAMKEIVEEGRPHPGGRRHFGYARPAGEGTWIIIPEEAAIAHEVRIRLLSGETLYSVAQDLNRREIWTSAG